MKWLIFIAFRRRKNRWERDIISSFYCIYIYSFRLVKIACDSFERRTQKSSRTDGCWHPRKGLIQIDIWFVTRNRLREKLADLAGNATVWWCFAAVKTMGQIIEKEFIGLNPLFGLKWIIHSLNHPKRWTMWGFLWKWYPHWVQSMSITWGFIEKSLVVQNRMKICSWNFKIHS